MTQQVLIESLSPNEARLTESIVSGKDYFLTGIMMQSEITNRNGRKYSLNEISRSVSGISEQCKSGNLVMGELNHPNNLSIDLQNVSHVITEAWMNGNDAYGKMKILNTPSGIIAKQLLDAGIKLGVSSRGSGEVYEGQVRDFNFVTVDIVATPSAPKAYPDLVREALENHKVVTLAEALAQDDSAQKYLKSEISKFLSRVLTR
jgi:hypothetical protein